MPFNFAISPRADSGGETDGHGGARLYPAEGLADMQSLLAAVADLETSHEVARGEIETLPGSDEMKRQRLAELDERHRARREPYQGQWERLTGALHRQAAALEGG
jgi:hypothetical protein